MNVLRLLPLMAVIGAALAGPAHAQGLLELYESARAYDGAAWQFCPVVFIALMGAGTNAYVSP